MGEHKFKQAYDKGFDAGKRAARTEFLGFCVDEMTPQERIKLLYEWDAELPFAESVWLKCIEDIKTDIENKIADSLVEGFDVKTEVFEIIDKHVKELRGEA